MQGSAAIDQVAHGFDFVAYVDRLKSWGPFAPAPATDPFLVELNRVQQESQLLGQTRTLIYSLLATEELDGTRIAPVDAAWAEAFVDQVDLGRLDDLEVVDVRLPEPEYATSDRYLEVTAGRAAVQGADALEERVALVTFEGQHYLVGFTLLRYGDGWYVWSQSSPLARTTPMGPAEPTTVEDYEELTTAD